MKVIALLRKNGIVFLKSSVISVIVCIFFAAGCVLAAKALSDKNTKSYTQMKIAVVNNDTSENSDLAVKLLTSSVKSLNAVFSMSVMEESKAFEEIENGNISGILLISAIPNMLPFVLIEKISAIKKYWNVFVI